MANDSTKVLWRVQVRTKGGSWINKGLFETRAVARERCRALRIETYGYGNTRVVRFEK